MEIIGEKTEKVDETPREKQSALSLQRRQVLQEV